MTPPPPPLVHIIRPESVSAELQAQVDAIFFETALAAPASGSEREAFRERWLGRYLRGGSDVLLVALTSRQTVAGYLVGALDDPAEQDRFADIGYFRGPFRPLTARYPSHLHINLTAAARNQGIGGQLIEAFATHATAAGSPGVHVVTSRDARNVRFYRRCGFREVGATDWNGSALVFLGRTLSAAGTDRTG